MASASTNGGSLPPNFYLTPQQQNLLFTALNANKQQSSSTKNGLSLSPGSFRSAPLQNIDSAGFHEGPYIDGYDYDFGNSSLDFSFVGEPGQSNAIGDLSADTAASSKSDSTEDGTPEKRSHPDDEDDDESPGNESKRHEGSDKIPKKPGRKPLTSEPTSKRKAQNRAAQRAFRERKEKHLKDLETKVEELEKASDAANHENSMLRAQVERITTELNHYKQQMTLLATKPASRNNHSSGTPAVNNIHDVNFQFEFPKFGALPGPPASKPQRSSSKPISPHTKQAPSPEAGVPQERQAPQAARNSQFPAEGFAKFSNHYTPSMSSSAARGSRASDSANLSLNGYISSPSASSHSNMGASSSCGTSPEAFTQSPMGTKPIDTLTTIGEEQPTFSIADPSYGHFSNVNYGNNGLEWLVQQNGGQFDPQLFSDYREPQDNILTNHSFDDLFNESLDADFIEPYFMAPSPGMGKKSTLIDEIDAQQSAIDDDLVPQEPMNCHQLWSKLQACPKAQSGEFDLDGLCSELTKKAKCSGSGPVVAERDFDTILKKYMGKDVSSETVAGKMGITVEKDRPASLAI